MYGKNLHCVDFISAVYYMEHILTSTMKIVEYNEFKNMYPILHTLYISHTFTCNTQYKPDLKIYSTISNKYIFHSDLVDHHCQ